MFGRLLHELLRSISLDYCLIWEGNNKYLSVVRRQGYHNRVIDIAFHDLIPSKSGSQESRFDFKGHGAYFGDDVAVLVSGPAVLQRILIFENAEGEVEDLLVDRRSEIWPRSIADDELVFDYKILYRQQDKIVIYVVFLRKKTLSDIYSFCHEHGLEPGRIRPAVDLLFQEPGDRLKSLIENGFTVRGISLEEEFTGTDGDIGIIRPLLLEQDNNSSSTESVCERVRPNEVNLKELLRTRSGHLSEANGGNINLSGNQESILKSIFMRTSRIFRPMVLLLLSLFILMAALNVYITVKESILEESLQEFQFKRSGIERLQNEIQDLRRKVSDISLILEKKKRLSSYLCEVGRLNPDNAWLRRLSIARGNNSEFRLRLSGLSIGQESGTEFLKALSRSTMFPRARLNDLSSISKEDIRGVPGRYSKNIYKFTIDLDTAL